MRQSAGTPRRSSRATASCSARSRRASSRPCRTGRCRSLRRRRAVRRRAVPRPGRDAVVAVEGDPIERRRSRRQRRGRSAAALGVDARAVEDVAGRRRAWRPRRRPSSSIRRAPAFVQGRAPALAGSPVPRIVYVSCDVATLARDSRRSRPRASRWSRSSPSICSRTRRTSRRSPCCSAELECSDSGDVRLRRSVLRRRQEAREQALEAAGPPEVLGVPLHADAEARRRVFERFDHAVGRRGRDSSPSPSVFDRLVMAAVDRDSRSPSISGVRAASARLRARRRPTTSCADRSRRFAARW